MKAKKINRINDKLNFEWENGSSCIISLKHLRDNCPCAQCTSGEKGLSKFDIWLQSSLSEFRYKLEKIELVGNYAIRLIWADGHDVGIYRWEYLLELCENYKNNNEGRKL